MFKSIKPVLIAIAILLAASGCEPGVGSITSASDQAELGEIALKSSRWETRKTAVDKIADQATLAKIAIDDESPEVRAAAIGAMTGQSYLAYVALQSEHEADRAAADQKITDQVVLSNYIQQVGDSKTIDAILENRLTSQTLIAWLAINAPSANLRNAASQKVTSYEIYEETAAASPIKWARTASSPTMVRENH